jgi:hypothetical protein
MFGKAGFGFFVLLILVLQGCSSTKLVTSWSDEKYQGEKLSKLLVIGVFKDDLMRRHFEDQFAARLAQDGRKAEASYVYMPDMQAYREREKLEALVRKLGADGVLITALKDVENRKKYVPPRVDYVPGGPWGGYGYYGYYYQTMQPIYTPGYERTDKVVQLETRVFAVKTREMIWGGATESFNPSSSGKVVDELVRLVVSDMKNAGLLR